MTANSRIDLMPDPVLPQRDLLLDAAQAARRLSAQIGAHGPIQIRRCERLRVKYSPGASLRVLYRIQVGARTYTIAARAFSDGRSQSVFDRAARKAIPSGALQPVTHDAELDLVYWTFPNDRKIGSLSALSNPPESLATIDRNRWSKSRVVAYAPEKCVTAQCLSETGNLLAYAKVYAAAERPSFPIYQSIWQRIQATNSNLRIPRALAYSEEDNMVLLGPLAGSRIADLRKADRLEGFRSLGTALANLHSLPVYGDLSPFTRLRPDRLTKAARIIGAARPDVAQLAIEVADELCNQQAALQEPDVCLHGDVHPKNGILQNGGMGLIDLDQAGTGPAAADLGSLLAALRYSRLVGMQSQADEQGLAASFLFGYSEARELPKADALRWHMAAALLAERSLRAIQRIRREGLEHLQELLHDARRLLTGVGYEY